MSKLGKWTIVNRAAFIEAYARSKEKHKNESVEFHPDARMTTYQNYDYNDLNLYIRPRSKNDKFAQFFGHSCDSNLQKYVCLALNYREDQ